MLKRSHRFVGFVRCRIGYADRVDPAGRYRFQWWVAWAKNVQKKRSSACYKV